jgi:hypothetical protein
MLDDIERRRFLIKPAGEDPIPLPVRPLDVDLNECPGELFLLPRRRCLARAQAHQQVLPSCRLARVKSDRLHDPVAFVENSENGDALRHRRHAALSAGRDGHTACRGRRSILLLLAAPARREREREQQ